MKQIELESMSDFEINKEMIKITKDWVGAQIMNLSKPNSIGYTKRLFIDGARIGCKTHFVDYCNDPSDIMPIAWENEIFVSLGNGNEMKYIATTMNRDKYSSSYSNNPYRAICIVFLRMKRELGK